MEQTKDNRLEQVTFLHALAQDFEHFDQTYLEARKTMSEYEKIPKKMTTEEWLRVIGALSEYYKSIKFLYKIALLIELGIIDTDLLYLFYYDEIIENLTFKLNGLIEWCGTGLDSGANYNPLDLARITGVLVNLFEKLNTVYQEHGADISFNERFSRVLRSILKTFLLIRENSRWISPGSLTDL